MCCRIGIIIILIFSLSLKSQSIYEISNNTSNEISIPPVSDNFKFSSINFEKIDSIHRDNKNVILRRKFGLQKYSFYKGVVKDEYFSNLIKFIPEVNIEKLLSKKFFKRANDNPDNDIINVYFYKNAIYVENLAKIYYYDKGWKKIDLFKKDTAPLTFLSFPESVNVFIDDINYGVTPLVLKEISPGTKIINFKKPGFYCYEFIVNKTIDIPILKRVIMHKMPIAPIGTYIDPETFSHGSIESIALLVNLLNNFRKEYEHLNQRIEKSEFDYIQNYPVLNPKSEFENINTFNRRKDIYKKIRDAGLVNLNIDLVSELFDIEQRILNLTKYLELLKRRQYRRFFESENLQIGNYDVIKEEFPIQISVNDGGHNFFIDGKLKIPFSMAERFKLEVDETLIKVMYRSIISLNNNNIENFLSYEYTGISILYKGSEYNIKGEIEFKSNEEQIQSTALKRDNK